jgi:hypothetical protein
MELLIAFIAGLIVMDLMWAFKLRIPQLMYYRWKHRNDPKPVYDEYDYEGRN